MAVIFDRTYVARAIRDELRRCQTDPSRMLTLIEGTYRLARELLLAEDREVVVYQFRVPAYRGEITLSRFHEIVLSASIETDLELELKCGQFHYDLIGNSLPFVLPMANAQFINITIRPKFRAFEENEVQAKVIACFLRDDLQHMMFAWAFKSVICEPNDHYKLPFLLFTHGRLNYHLQIGNDNDKEAPPRSELRRAIDKSASYFCSPRKLFARDRIDWTHERLYETSFSPDLCELARSKSTEFGAFARKNRLLARRVQQWLD